MASTARSSAHGLTVDGFVERFPVRLGPVRPSRPPSPSAYRPAVASSYGDRATAGWLHCCSVASLCCLCVVSACACSVGVRVPFYYRDARARVYVFCVCARAALIRLCMWVCVCSARCFLQLTGRGSALDDVYVRINLFQLRAVKWTRNVFVVVVNRLAVCLRVVNAVFEVSLGYGILAFFFVPFFRILFSGCAYSPPTTRCRRPKRRASSTSTTCPPPPSVSCHARSHAAYSTWNRPLFDVPPAESYAPSYAVARPPYVRAIHPHCTAGLNLLFISSTTCANHSEQLSASRRRYGNHKSSM